MLKIQDLIILILNFGVLMMMVDMVLQINASWDNKLLTLEENKIQNVLMEKILKDKQ
jgi:hypothetical protein